MIDPEDILAFWFAGVERNPELMSVQKNLWYGSRESTDRLITARFGEVLKRAEAQQLNHWQDTPNSRLALILVLDQFSRHVYRGTAAAFQNDDAALEIAVGFHDYLTLSPIEQVFANHPFKHAENLVRQKCSMDRFATLVNASLPEWKPIMENFYNNANRHYQIIKQFGRFPHRNEILKRTSTEEEKRFLINNRSRFGQTSK